VIQNLGARLQTLFVLIGLVILFGIASPHFLSADNLLNVMQQSAINAILGIGLTFVIISAGIDLSVGSILALCGLVVADLLVAGHSSLVAVGAGLLVGLGCGAVNGLITTLGRIPPFITTLGMMLIARSAAKIYSGSRPISGLPDSFRALSGNLAGVPVMVLVVAVFYVLAHLVLTRTKLGRYTYAIGGNEQAAWLSGVPVGRYKIAIYALSGLMAGVAAVLMTSRLNAASPLSGEMYELYAIAAAVIGGTSLMGGEGRVLGTLIGALIMGTLRNGLNALNVIPWSENGGYDFYDMVSSPLAQVTPDNWLERRPERRIWPVYFQGSNFGLVEFFMDDDPRLVFQLIDIHGRRVWEPFELRASELVNGVTSWPSKVTNLPRQRQEHYDAGEGYYEIPVED